MKKMSFIQIPRTHWKLLFKLSILLLLLVTACSKDVVDPVPETRSLQVWLHRVNTISRAQHFQDIYSGFELDVHFDTSVKTFIVKHNFTDTSTLTFSYWLSSINHPERLGYWLDFKNLSLENRYAALTELVRIRQAYGLKEHTIVVESDNPPALPPFDTLNFRISYYIPYFNPSVLTLDEAQTYYENINERVTENGISTISGYSIQHSFMQLWFPGMNKLLWYLDSYDTAIKDSVITLTRKDQTVEVLLVAEYYK
jgi:hypothetical protein